MNDDAAVILVYNETQRTTTAHTVVINQSEMAGAKRILILVVVALCLAGALSAKTPRDATTEQPLGFQDLVTRAQASISNASAVVANLLGLNNVPNTEAVVQALRNQSQVLNSKIEQIIGTLNREAEHHHSNISSVLSAISQRLNETLITPGVAQQASEIQDQITAGLNTVVKEAGQLAKALGGEASAVQEDLDKLARSAVEQVVRIGNQVEEQVKTAIADHQATHA